MELDYATHLALHKGLIVEGTVPVTGFKVDMRTGAIRTSDGLILLGNIRDYRVKKPPVGQSFPETKELITRTPDTRTAPTVSEIAKNLLKPEHKN